MLKFPPLYTLLLQPRLSLSLVACMLLGGCSGIGISNPFHPVNTSALSNYEQAKLNCSVVTGIESKTDWTVFSASGVSLGLRLPSSSSALDDLNYDRKLEDYQDCLRLAGI